MDKQIDKLAYTSLKKGIEQSLNNSSNLFECASQLAENKKFNVATSLMILSCEESIKTSILMSKHFGVSSDIPLTQFFKNHNIKHIEIAKVLKLLNSLDMLLNLSKLCKKSIANALFSLSNLLTLNSNQWWNNANSLKQNGFYVDFKNNKWIVPSRITKDDYIKASDYADILLRWLAMALPIISEENFKLSERL